MKGASSYRHIPFDSLGTRQEIADWVGTGLFWHIAERSPVAAERTNRLYGCGKAETSQCHILLLRSVGRLYVDGCAQPKEQTEIIFVEVQVGVERGQVWHRRRTHLVATCSGCDFLCKPTESLCRGLDGCEFRSADQLDKRVAFEAVERHLFQCALGGEIGERNSGGADAGEWIQYSKRGLVLQASVRDDLHQEVTRECLLQMEPSVDRGMGVPIRHNERFVPATLFKNETRLESPVVPVKGPLG